MEDSSLDEFLAGGEENSEVDTDDPEADTDDPEDVTPATPTYRWSPDETVCDSCGGATRRRWQSEAGLVCRECKQW
jgi:hypothetical protein